MRCGCWREAGRLIGSEGEGGTAGSGREFDGIEDCGVGGLEPLEREGVSDMRDGVGGGRLEVHDEGGEDFNEGGAGRAHGGEESGG